MRAVGKSRYLFFAAIFLTASVAWASIETHTLPQALAGAGKQAALSETRLPDNSKVLSLPIKHILGFLAQCWDGFIPPEKKVYLTFDDGPTDCMADILDALEQYKAVATFFVMEPRVRTHADLVQRAVAEGHALGSHGVTHRRRLFYKSTQSMISELDRGIAAIQEVAGVDTPLVRVPYGTVPNVSRKQIAALLEHGYKLWDWNVDSRDWKTQNSKYVSTVIRQLKSLLKKKVSPVILLHDIKSTAKYLPSLLEYLQDNGYVFRVLDPSLPEYYFGVERPPFGVAKTPKGVKNSGSRRTGKESASR